MSSASDYSELTQREHVLKRPELFMGNTEVVRWDRPEWVVTGDFPQTVKVEQRMLTGSDALVRIWIEPFSNAMDSVFRSNRPHSKSRKKGGNDTENATPSSEPVSKARATFISVVFDEESQRMTIENDGWGIPLEMQTHVPVSESTSSHQPALPMPTMIPTMIFSRYSTSSNYNDDEQRITSGLNGLGSKLTNTMSSEFGAECKTCSIKMKKHPWQAFRQVWSNNMSTSSEPELTEEDKPEGVHIQPGYGTVKVWWIPDWSRFGGTDNSATKSVSARSQPRPYPRYLPDELAYIKRLVLDASMQMGRYGVQVLWNRTPVKVGTLLDYARVFVPLPEEQRLLEEQSRTKGDEPEQEDTEPEAESEPEPEPVSGGSQEEQSAPSVQTESPSVPLWKQVIYSEMGDCEVVIVPLVSPDLGGPKLVKARDPLVMSFVNGIYTAEGGLHVTGWEKETLKPLLTKLKLNLEVRDIRRYFALFVNAFRVNKPKFSTQSKTKLIDSGSTLNIKVNKSVITQLSKWTVIELIRAEDLARNKGLLDKFSSTSNTNPNKFKDIEFEDANFARVPSKRQSCVLVGCEGKSASAFVKNSLNAPPPAHLLCIPSKDYVGVFPFRGKGLNVTNCSVEKLAKNKEVQTIIRILGLRTDLDYRDPTNRKSLRYGKFLMIGDADLDGFHIVSLLYNFFATLYPTLLQNTEDPFFFFLRTPIITLRPSGKSSEQELHLYSWLHAHAYLDQLYADPSSSSHSKWKIIYRKGLGVWNEREPKVEVGRRPVHLYWTRPALLPSFQGSQAPVDNGEGSNSHVMDDEKSERLPSSESSSDSSVEVVVPTVNAVDLEHQMVVAREFLIQVFHKDNASFRRKWLDDYIKTRRALQKTVVTEIDPSITTADYEISQQSVKDFLSQELILFNEAWCGRNLPRRDDGLKLSQRKILFSAIVKPLPFTMADPLKVSQFSGYVAENTQYHYGDKSLNDAIIKLAQSYVGSNNIPLLYPEGNFGSRDDMGKDAAACRYIHTKLSCMTRMLFREEDDSFLPNEYEDGHVVEKKEYVPILPMLLVNGASGLASGWSSKVPPHNPVVLADWIRVWLTRRERQESGGTEPNELELESVPESESESKSEQSPTDMESSLPVFPTLLPWWRGFKGTVRTTNQSNRFLIWGAISKLPAPNVLSKTQTIVQVNEIPLGMASISIKKYRKILEQMRDAGKLDFVDHSDSFQIDFKVLIKSNSIDMETSTDDEIMLFLKLRSWFASQLVCLTGTPTEIVRYNTVEEILDKYCERRLELFETVRQGQIQKTLHQIEVEQNKQRFIQAVVDKVIVLSDYEDSEIERKLEQMKFMVDPDKGKGYTYLLEMAVRSITKTRIQALKDKIVRLQVKLSELRMSTRFGIWRQCLRTWQDTWIDWVSTEEALNVKSRTKKEGGGRGTGGNKTSRTKTRVGKK